MATEGYKRKLTTILSADVAGYSRLMGDDEAATLKTLTTHKGIMADLIKQHRGRVIDSPGDNVLAEFTSVVDGVQCAVAVQKELQARNAELSEDRRMEFRIGINLGDVIEEEDRIYGDGVNIAARLEALADPGGICISKTAFDHIETKLPLGYEYLGEQSVKNIPKPVGAYRVLMEPRVTVAEEIEKVKAVPVWRRKAFFTGAIAVLVAIIAVVIWNFYLRPSPIEPASVGKMAFPLPDKPSIAVLPFDNLTGDPQQEYLSDGMTEEIITALSKVPYLFVIARNSTFSYKGKPVKIHQVAEELGVRYVLEGSVRRTENRVRVTAQLIDAIKGHHLWAERYERELKDTFALQDEITMKILVALEVRLTEGEQATIRGKGTNNLEAYLKTLQAIEYLRRTSKEGVSLARQLAEEAIALDPQWARPYRLVATCHITDIFWGLSKSRKKSMEQAVEMAQKAISLDDSDPCGYNLLSMIYQFKRQYERALAEAERAIALDPNYADAYSRLGTVLAQAGRQQESIAPLEKSIRINPMAPSLYFRRLGLSYRDTGRYEEAIAAYKKAINLAPDSLYAHLGLAATYSLAGRDEEARAEASEVLRIQPKFSLESVAKRVTYKNKADIDRMIDALRKAGLPETPPLPLPDKPSIAVLPFTNIGDDPKQEYFADGMTEDLITDLSKISGLFIIARNSVFQYKGKAVDVKKISRELGVRYLLEGSIRRADDKVRINAQLIDATTGGHLWAERYDGKMGDVFGLQDKITEKIVASLAVELTSDEKENVARRGTDNAAAYDAFVQGREYYLRHTRDDMVKAVTSLKRAIELDPNFPQAHAVLSMVYSTSRSRRWDEDLGWTDARSLAEKHLQLAMRNPTPKVHRVAAWDYIWKRQHEKAIAEAERSLTLEPNNSKSHSTMGAALIYAGRSKEAIEAWKKAMRLDPYYPAIYLWWLGLAQFCVGQLEEAATSIERAHKRKPNLSAWPLAATYAHMGREQEAADLITEYVKRRGWKKMPTVKGILRWFPFKDPKDKDRFTEGLRKAGVPME